MTLLSPIRRRHFSSRIALSALAAVLLPALFAACGGSETDGLDSDQQDLSGTRIRIMEGNISTGTGSQAQSYDNGAGIRIFQGLKPDIAMVQECNYLTNSTADIDTFIHTAFGASFNYYRETISGSATIPNCVVSRFPILSSGSYTDPAVSNRAFAWAKIKLPSGQSLWAFSLHLLTTSATNRDTEAKALVADIKANIPAGDYLAIGGDFNTSSRTEAMITDLSAVVATAGPYPVDNKGNSDTSENRNKPHDWLLAGNGLDALKTPAVVGTSTFADGLVVDTRVYTPLSDIAPALESDSADPDMQHMAVVRDFLLSGTVVTAPKDPVPPTPREGLFPVSHPRPLQPASH